MNLIKTDSKKTIDRIQELLIVSITPQNLERDVLWFSENHKSIKHAKITNPWWRENVLLLENDLVIKPSEIIRRLMEFGYERTQIVRGKGLFAVRGGIIDVWPINTEKPYLVEFLGNAIESLQEREEKFIEAGLNQYHKNTASIEQLLPGGFVVHTDHGIGIFRGKESSYFLIEYAPPHSNRPPDRLYVPWDKKDRLAPYIGFETPHIHRLGGTLWHNTKRKITEDVEKLARELLELYVRREIAERPPNYGDMVLLEEFRSNCPFQETEDQLRAEKEILKDLSEKKPMDRILCGDVGFGKTEVAMRAALHVISSGKQVVFLTPTTVLAAQHEKTFLERINNQLPINTAMLSRLTSVSEQKRILQELKEGRLDLIIGTHRLFSRDVIFNDLGLVIIDEEQRFGVKHKEHLKTIRANIDILSLSATPIPRTLSLMLAKLRGITLLENPPPERKPINTFVLPYSLKTIRRAILYELKRGGQIYFLHNRIETLAAVKEKIQKLMLKYIKGPQKILIKIGILHGRMHEKEIIKVMEQFRNKEIKMLIATTIIENGLDISSANTLIIDDATRLGLAEAHQLRGRVGRGKEQAFAYFLYRPRSLTEKASERLKALQEYVDLGSGYHIALRDLEIRGAGNIFGKEQSGAVNKVGLNLYYQMLAEAIQTLTF